MQRLLGGTWRRLRTVFIIANGEGLLKWAALLRLGHCSGVSLLPSATDRRLAAALL